MKYRIFCIPEGSYLQALYKVIYNISEDGTRTFYLDKSRGFQIVPEFSSWRSLPSPPTPYFAPDLLEFDTFTKCKEFCQTWFFNPDTFVAVQYVDEEENTYKYANPDFRYPRVCFEIHEIDSSGKIVYSANVGVCL